MAKNREVKHQPPKPVESESSEEEDDETSSGSDSEPELTANEPKSLFASPVSALASSKKTQPLSVQKPPQQEPSEEEESESESDSESESSDSPNPKVSSIATEPVSNLKSSTVSKNPSSKPSADPVTPSKPSIVKHPAEEKEKGTDAKKSKKKVDPEASVKKVTDDPKKQPFQRIWSEDDEIVILKGMIEYSTKKKGDPLADVSAFHNFIKKNLDNVDVTDTQLLAKIKRLKKKYQTNKSKETDGKERAFSKAHERKAYDLSKVVWGNVNVKENGSEKVVETPKVNNGVVKRELDNDNIETVLPAKRMKFFGGDVEDRILMMGNEMFEEGIGGGAVTEAEEWKSLKVEEIDAYLRYLDVKARRAKLVMKNLDGRK